MTKLSGGNQSASDDADKKLRRIQWENLGLQEQLTQCRKEIIDSYVARQEGAQRELKLIGQIDDMRKEREELVETIRELKGKKFRFVC